MLRPSGTLAGKFCPKPPAKNRDNYVRLFESSLFIDQRLNRSGADDRRDMRLVKECFSQPLGGKPEPPLRAVLESRR